LFLTKHTNDEDFVRFLSNPDARWWPEWHAYEIVSDRVPEFGIVRNFTVYSENIDLYIERVLVGPFNFADTTSRKRQLTDTTQWSRFSDACMCRGIAPPKLNTHTLQRGQTAATYLVMNKRTSSALEKAHRQDQGSSKHDESHDDMRLESQIAMQMTAREPPIANNGAPMQAAMQIADKALHVANETIANHEIARQNADNGANETTIANDGTPVKVARQIVDNGENETIANHRTCMPVAMQIADEARQLAKGTIANDGTPAQVATQIIDEELQVAKDTFTNNATPMQITEEVLQLASHAILTQCMMHTFDKEGQCWKMYIPSNRKGNENKALEYQLIIAHVFYRNM
jgi:hypothetical protein